MEQINTWSGGLDTDTTKTKLSSNKYRSGRNIRIITEGKDSTDALVTVDGNSFLVAFPTTSNVLKLEITGTFPLTVSFLLNGIAISGTVNSYQQITDLINSSVALQALGIKASTGDTYVLLHSTLSNNVTITLNIVGTVVSNVLFTTLITSQSNLQPIGWGLIRDEIIICTTNNTTLNPGGHDVSLSADPSSVGQIWKLTYDVVSFAPTLELLYNNYVDFTTYHPFRKEGQSEGRYEANTIKPFYWTDNFNTLRKFNTADPNGFALDVSLLDYRPQLDSSVPILKSINDSGGKTKIGIYQCAYKLKNLNGGETVYSKCSNQVPIINGTPQSNTFVSYVGAPPTTVTQPKTITWSIDNIDTDYQRIEIVILFRENRDDAPTIDTIINEPVPQSGSFTFTYTGFETTTPVDLNTFLDITSSFTHCKTLASKDNLLLVANTRNVTFDVDFDARAYRFPQKTSAEWVAGGGNKTTVKDSQGNLLTVDKTLGIFPNQWNVTENHDAINPDQSSQNINSYRFQSNGTTIGGEGPNIKYKFNTRWFTGDDVLGFTTNTTTSPFGYNSRFTNRNSGPFTLANNSFTNNNFYNSLKSEYISSAFKGYQHDEIYPFAIRFYDKTGRPGFAKWIGDIRMPLIYESLDSSIPTYSNYLTTDRNGFNGAQRIGILVPEFTVNIPSSLKSKISGFEIIRCERTADDKTILASGVLQQASFDSVGGSRFLVNSILGTDYITDNAKPDATNHPNEKIDGTSASFISPEFQFLRFPGFQSGDLIKVVAQLDKSYAIAATDHHFAKHYTSSNPGGSIIKPLFEAIEVLKAGTSSSTSPLTTINNYSSTDGAGDIESLGDSTLFIRWPGSGSLNWNPGTPFIFYAYYIRPRTAQYGGKTYSQRSSREYISCGHFQPITPTSSNIFTVELAGGDIYTTIFDTQKVIKNWNVLGTPATKKSHSIFFPVETVLNTEWRYGNHVNHTGLPNTGTETDNGDDYLLNTCFSAEDNTKKAYPKPVDFINIQENDSRIYASEFKINGEPTDSWGIFPVNDFQDADSQFGPINNLLILKGQIIGLQDTGCFLLPVNPKVTIPDNSASELLLGTGQKIPLKPNYISTTDGCKHQWGNISTEDAIYFFNAKNSTFNKLTNQCSTLSFDKKCQNIFNVLEGDVLKRDNTVHNTATIKRAGVVMTYDSSNIEILTTFHDYLPSTSTQRAFTIAYNENANNKQGEFTCDNYDFKPGIYINDKTNVFSIDTSNLTNLYIHGTGNPAQFYGVTYPSSISFIISTQAKEAVWDNFEWDSQVTDLQDVNISNETFDQIRVYNDYQNSDYQALTVNTSVKRKKRKWNIVVPRSIVVQNPINLDIFNTANLNALQLFKARMRSKYIQVDLSFPNVSNGQPRRILCPFIQTISRQSAR